MTPDDLLDRIKSVAASIDQPFGNSSLLPSVICAERAREDGITKLLAGDGGDELFGGNTRYAKQKVLGLYGAIPRSLRRGLVEPLARLELSARVPLVRKVKSYVDQATVPFPDRLETHNILEYEGLSSLLPDYWVRGLDVDNPRRLQKQVWDDLVGPGPPQPNIGIRVEVYASR